MRIRVKHHRSIKSGRYAGEVDIYFSDHDSRKLYRLADPAFGDTMHLKRNAIFASSEAAAVHLVRKHGFHLEMRGYLTGQFRLVAPEEIEDIVDA